MSMKATKEQFIGVTYEELLAENAKLRELSVEMYWDLVAEMPESLLMDRKQQLKELGIEVD